MKILLVEDEIRTAHYLRRGLVESGFAVDVMASSDAQANSHHADYDLLVCDMGAGAGRRPRHEPRPPPIARPFPG